MSDVLFWRLIFGGCVLAILGGLISLRLQVERLQNKMDTTVGLLLTWAQMWGKPDAEVRLALGDVVKRYNGR